MVVPGLIIALTVTLALALGGFIAALLALARLNALEDSIAEAALTRYGVRAALDDGHPSPTGGPRCTGYDRPTAIGVGWGDPKIRLVASRRDGFFSGDGAA